MEQHEVTKPELSQTEQLEPTELAPEFLHEVTGGLSQDQRTGSIAATSGVAGIAAGGAIGIAASKQIMKLHNTSSQLQVNYNLLEQQNHRLKAQIPAMVNDLKKVQSMRQRDELMR